MKRDTNLRKTLLLLLSMFLLAAFSACGASGETTATEEETESNLVGGSGQLYPVFRWGTLCDSGLISDTGTAQIR